MSYQTDIKKILKEAQHQGFRIERGKHWKLYPPDRTKGVVFISQSPSCHRAIENILADLRVAGFVEKS